MAYGYSIIGFDIVRPADRALGQHVLEPLEERIPTEHETDHGAHTGAPDSLLKAENDNGAKDASKVEAQTRQFNVCMKGSKDQLEGARKELARVGQKDAPMFFRCGPIGTNWQMIPSNTCCDPFRRDSDKNMEAAAAALQRCGWNEEFQKRQTAVNQKTEECKKKYPGARP